MKAKCLIENREHTCLFYNIELGRRRHLGSPKLIRVHMLDPVNQLSRVRRNTPRLAGQTVDPGTTIHGPSRPFDGPSRGLPVT